MEVLVESKIESLKIVDNKTNQEYTMDLLGNAGALVYNQETGLPELSQDDFEWWSEYIKTEGKISSRKEAIWDEIYISNSAEEIKNFSIDITTCYSSGDYSETQKNTIAVLEDWEKKLSINNQ